MQAWGRVPDQSDPGLDRSGDVFNLDLQRCDHPALASSRRGHPVCAVFVVVDVAAAAAAAVVVVVVVAAAQAVEVRDSEDDDEDYEMTHGGRSDGADGETTDGDHSDGAHDHDWPGVHVSRDGFWSFGAKYDPRLARGGSLWVRGYVAELDPLELRGSLVGECEAPSPSDSEESDGESLAYRDQFGKRIKLGSKMPPVPPWAEEAVKERQRPPEA